MRRMIQIGFLAVTFLLFISTLCYLCNNDFGNSQAKENNPQDFDFSGNITENTLFQRANQPLDIPTYDGSGQLTHPSILYFPEKWHNHKYWAVATPYPNSDDRYENPSIYCFDTPGENWIVPANLTDPIAPQPSMGFNSDPCLAYNKTSNELYCFYRDYNYTDLTISYYILKSSDGISWSSPILLYTLTSNKPTLCSNMPLLTRIYTMAYLKIENIIHQISHKKILAGGTSVEISNEIVQLPNGKWISWEVLAPNSVHSIVHRTSADCLHWSEPKNCSFIDGSYDRTVWHIDVKYIPELGRFLMVQYSAEKNRLTLAESIDGIEWKYYSNSILNPDNKNTTNFANSHLYKSSLTYDPLDDTVNLWYTGVNTKNEWKIGYTNISYSRLQNFCSGNSIK